MSMEISHPVFYFTGVWSNPELGWIIDLNIRGARMDTPYSLLMSYYYVPRLGFKTTWMR
jgi:hypothetical protein